MEVHVVGREAQRQAELFDVFERIDAWRQNEENRRGWAGLLEGLREFNASSFDVLGSQLLFNVSPAEFTSDRQNYSTIQLSRMNNASYTIYLMCTQNRRVLHRLLTKKLPNTA